MVDIKKTFLILVLLVLFTLQATAYTINDDLVYTNTSKVYIGARPHTLTSDGWVEIGLISKVLSGDIDVAIGFNTTTTTPSKPRIWKLNTSSWNNTYYWKTLKVDNIIYRDYDGKNVWYIIKNVSVNSNQLYKLLFYVDINGTGKYDVAVKPSSDTIQTAIANNRFLFLDPWYNETESLTNTNCTSNDWTNLDNGSSTAGYDTKGNIRLSFPFELNLIRYWFFENNTIDEKCANDGTNNGATYTASGKIGGAYTFVNNDYINFNSVGFGNIFDGTSNGFTVSYWLNTNSVSTRQYHIMPRCENSLLLEHYNQVVFARVNQGVWKDVVGESNSTITSTNTWYHIVFTYDTTNGWSLYVDSNLIDVDASTGTISSESSDCYFGLAEDESSNGLNGELDEVSIYNRTLNATEVSTLYNSGVGVRYDTSKNKFYSKVNETGSDINWFVPTINITDNTFTTNITVCTNSRANCIAFTETNNSENISITQGDNLSFSFSLGGNATSSPLIHNWGMLSGLTATASDTCTAPSINNDWTINISDNCNITSNVDLGTGKLYVQTDAGILTINANLTVKEFHFTPTDFDGDSTIRILKNGGRLEVKP